jgi:hypothetical protein
MAERSTGDATASGEDSAAAGVDVRYKDVTVQQVEDTVIKLAAEITEADCDNNYIVILTNTQPQTNNPNDISPNLKLHKQEEGKWGSFDNIEIERGAGGCLHPSVNGNDIQHQYVEGIQKRLQ